MSDTIGFTMALPPELAVGAVHARARWFDGERTSIQLVPALDEAVGFATLAFLDRVRRGAIRLQELSDGRAFPGEETGFSSRVNNRFIEGLLSDRLFDVPYAGEPSFAVMTLGWLELPSGQVELLGAGIELGEGSLWTKINAFLGGGALVAVACLILEGPVDDVHGDLKWKAELNRMLDGAPCTTEVAFDPSLGALRALSAEALRFETSSDGEQHDSARVCAVQLLLRWAGEHPGPIDGLPGRQTRSALDAFAAKHGLGSDDERVFDHLIDTIQRPRD